MKLGIIGLPLSGKKTVFEALTKKFDSGFKNEDRLETVTVPDKRIDKLSAMFEPQKTIYAQIKYFLPKKQENATEKDTAYNNIRDCDAIIQVIKNFKAYADDKISPYEDVLTLEQELTLADFITAEKRIERIATDKKRGKQIDNQELSLLKEALQLLEAEKPIRKNTKIATARQLRGFTFLTAKPKLLLFNNDDEDENIPSFTEKTDDDTMVLRGKLEHEIMQMPEKEAFEFLKEFNISDLAMDRVIKKSYDLLGLISFFTVGKDEVRAWTIKKGTSALDAADVIHSDIKKGFIRAEVVAYNDLIKAGGYPKAKEAGTVRLEGKTYIVADGDIINFRFNV
ncbi:MAG: redox-regulated ATPase YchF [Deltaproteobacteria bacterium]|nr:redox-regulated ATPase YchF [Deltaproteobacteria bacterium]